MASRVPFSPLRWALALFIALSFGVTACGGGSDDDFDPIDVSDVDIPDADLGDADSDDDPDSDTDTDNDADTDVDPDANDGEEPVEAVQCDRPIPEPPSGQRCTITPGTSDQILLRGTILSGDEVYEEGSLLLGDESPNRRISCVGCDCADEAAAADATIIECPEGVISPGLINPHDHLTYAEGRPQAHGEERFDHRHDWRRGLRGHDEVSTTPRTGGSREVVLYGELRMLFGGATSIAGSTGFVDGSGLLRNMDNPDDTEGLDTIDVDYRTFPLGDGGNPVLTDSGCGYPNIDSDSRLESDIYLPHIAEGIDGEAQNELHCLAGGSAYDLVQDNTSIIHGIAVDARDVAQIADRGAHLVWSARTNIDLYGNTAPVPLYQRFGVPIALGTDWSTSGSMNMLRELQCADYLNRLHYDETFTDQEIWKMATYNAAIAMGAEDELGILYEDYVADITIFDGTGHYPYRAVLDAEIDDIALVMRGGSPLYGDAELIEGLVSEEDLDQCEVLDICERDRRACVELDTNLSLADIESGVHPDSYPLYFCDDPEDEPTCVPSRPDEYSGITDDQDISGDGIPDSMDNCPDYFNPIRPMDGATQGDTNGNGVGDVCDPCPLSEDPDCEVTDPNDWSGDGYDNDEDNCPYHFNPDQTDTSGDGIGDACSPCPEHFLEPGEPCPGSIYDVKTGEASAGDGIALNDVLVTAVLPETGIFIQVHPDDANYDGVEFSGLFVYLANAPGVDAADFPTPGDRIDIVGAITDFFGQIQLVDVQELEILSSDNDLPSPYVVDPEDAATGGSLQEELEGVLVTVEDVVVTDTDVAPGPGDSDPTNEFIVDESLQINDYFYLTDPFPAVDDTIQSITGILRWANDNSKLEPRSADDIHFAPPALDSLTPAQVYLDADGGPQSLLEVNLDREAETAVTVDLTYSDDTVVDGPDSVTLQPGEQSVSVELEALTVSPDPVTIEASYDGVTATAEIVTYDDNTERTLESVELADSNDIFIGDTIALEIALNFPAGSAGASATLSIAPEADLVFEETADFAAGEQVLVQPIEIGTTTGDYTASVDFAGDTLTVDFSVASAPPVLETFDNFAASANAYEDGTFVGDGGFEWSYSEARRGPVNSAPEIDGTGLILRDETSTLIAENVPGGISSFSVDLTQAFTGGGVRQVELFVNGDSYGTSDPFGDGDDVHGDIFEFAVDNIDVSGEFEIELRSVGPKQITIDNLSWTP